MSENLSEMLQSNSETLQQKRTPEQIGAEIREIVAIGKGIQIKAAIEIGRRLIEAKEMLNHGEWMPWLRQETAFSQSSATRYMNIYRKYKDQEMTEDWEKITSVKAELLSRIPEEERNEVAKEINAANLSTQELKEELHKRYGAKNGERKPTQHNAGDIELKPCPHCGGEAELMIKGQTEPDGDITGYILVKCTVCESTGKSCYYHGPDLDKWDHKLSESVGAAKAVKVWNMRWNG